MLILQSEASGDYLNHIYLKNLSLQFKLFLLQLKVTVTPTITYRNGKNPHFHYTVTLRILKEYLCNNLIPRSFSAQRDSFSPSTATEISGICGCPTSQRGIRFSKVTLKYLKFNYLGARMTVT